MCLANYTLAVMKQEMWFNLQMRLIIKCNKVLNLFRQSLRQFLNHHFYALNIAHVAPRLQMLTRILLRSRCQSLFIKNQKRLYGTRTPGCNNILLTRPSLLTANIHLLIKLF